MSLLKYVSAKDFAENIHVYFYHLIAFTPIYFSKFLDSYLITERPCIGCVHSMTYRLRHRDFSFQIVFTIDVINGR